MELRHQYNFSHLGWHVTVVTGEAMSVIEYCSSQAVFVFRAMCYISVFSAAVWF